MNASATSRRASVMVIGLSAILLLAAGPLARAEERPAEKTVGQMMATWQDGWNRHDVAAIFILFTEDADFVNVAGLHWHGRREIEAEHATRLRTNLGKSVWTTRSIEVQELSPTLLLAHIGWGISGDTDFDGTPRAPREGIFSWVLVKVGDDWKVRAAQNTELKPRK